MQRPLSAGTATRAPWILLGLACALPVLLPAPEASAGGFARAAVRTIDPEEASAVLVRETGVAGSPFFYALGGRFAGDLDGDGLDDFVLPDPTDDSLHLFFGDADWSDAEGLLIDPSGETTLRLPQGCRAFDAERGLESIPWAVLGDLNDDDRVDIGVGCYSHSAGSGASPIQGAVAIYLGRAARTPVRLSPDLLLLGTPVLLDEGGEPVSGDRIGASVAGVGDLDDDGFDDFVALGFPWIADDQPVAFVFRGGPSPASSLLDADDADWVIRGGPELRCLTSPQAALLGDIDAHGAPDFALGCRLQPPPVVPGDPEHVPNAFDIAFSAFRGEALTSLGPRDDLGLEDRSFGWTGGSASGLDLRPGTALGDMDGDGIDDFGARLVLLGGEVGFRPLRGEDTTWSDLGPLSDWTSWLADGTPGDPGALDFSSVADLSGDSRRDLWLRHGLGDDARVELIPAVDRSTWVQPNVPPALSSFGPPSGIGSDTPWRFGLGGTGDADGDGNPDLLIVAGSDDGAGCGTDHCGGAWLILCRDADEDGLSVCLGDCDDTNPAIRPGLLEQCDAIDHDCDGSDGQTDADGDGVQGCAGDCDDDDDTVLPGAAETCADTVDRDCDGLLPSEDEDGDGAINCEDCQPWLESMTPGAAEVCDGLDNDCDGRLPREEADVDRDGVRDCAAEGEVGDCDDGDPFVGPQRHEECSNGRDDDCDGEIDDSTDADGDGVTTCMGDCDDAEATVFPGASEEPVDGVCDGLDNDCNDLIDDARDRDGDGVDPCAGDCDEDDPTRHAGATGVCDGSDADCDGEPDLLDGDGDGMTACSGDCDDTDPGVRPGAPERCDRIDNDCDGTVDLEFDVDEDGWAGCHGDCADDDPARRPEPVEPLCTDGADGDCDLLVDLEDPDCLETAPPADPEARPYGLSCSDCGGSVAGGASSGRWALLLLPLMGLRRRRGARATPVASIGVLALLLLVPAPARAAKAETGLIVYLSDRPDLRAMVEAREAVPEVEAAEVLHLSEFLPPAEGNLVAADVLDQRACPGGAGPDLRAAAEDVLDRLIDLDHRGARDRAAAVLEDLPCATEPLPRGLMADLLFYRGVAEEQLGPRSAAEESFARLLAVAPDHPGDPNFPPEANQLLQEVRAAHPTPSPVELVGLVPPGGELRVDGVRAARGGKIEIFPGRHLVQISRGRSTWSLEVDVLPGSRPIVVLSADRLRALRDAGLSAAGRAWTVHSVVQHAAEMRIDLIALVDLDAPSGASAVWLYRPSIDRFSFEADLALGGRSDSPARRAKARPDPPTSRGARSAPAASRPGKSASRPVPTRARVAPRAPDPEEDRLRLRISGAYSLVLPFHYAAVPLEAGIRIVRGLTLDVGLESAFAPTETYGTIWLPTIEVGASWRFETELVQPRAGVGLLVAIDSSTGEISGTPGFAVRGGMDFLPPARPLFFGFDVGAGVLGTAFRLRVSAGAGVRF